VIIVVMASSIPRGGVSVRLLPVVSPPIPDGGGRVIGPAGELVQVVNGDHFRFAAYIEFKAGAARARHYHRYRTETLYVISGLLQARYRDVTTGDTTDVVLSAGHLVTVRPGCAHLYRAVEYSQVMELSDRAYDPSDTVAYDFGTTTGGERNALPRE
jgi:quercetin dioxygenase-like cupin family protein